MPQILFSLAEPRVLVLAVLCTSVTIYFLTLRDKTLDLGFLIGAFSCWTAHFLLDIGVEALYPLPRLLPIVEMAVGLVGLLLFAGFAYRFRANPYAREFRFGLALASTLAAATVSFLLIQFAAHRPLTWAVGSGVALTLFLWSETVLIRRWIASPDPREARPYREFASIFLLSVAAVGIYFLRDLGVVSGQFASVVSSLLYLSTLVGFTLVYVNNAPRPTTFRVKIVGAALFAVLAVLTVTWTALAPPEASEISSRLAMQASIIRYNYCILGSTIFVLLFFPVFFRSNLVEPLNALLKAVDCVDDGLRLLNTE